MIVLQLRKGPADEAVGERWADMEQHLPDGFVPLLRPARELQSATFSVPASQLSKPEAPWDSAVLSSREPSPIHSEVYTDGRAVVVLLIDPPRERLRFTDDGAVVDEGHELTLRLYLIGPELNPACLRSFEEVVRSRLQVDLVPDEYHSSRFRELKHEGQSPPPDLTSADIEAARILADPSTRALAVAIKSSGGLLLGDVPKQLPAGDRGNVNELERRLTENGLVASEAVVVCKSRQAQVARAPSREALEEMANKGMKCGCGRNILDESVEAALTITESGRRLLDSSHWFSVLLVERLLALGVARNKVMLNQSQGGDEMDVLADISGELVFFELKDKVFSLGNAYSFGAKIGLMKPEHSVIVTTETVGNDAKDHFTRAWEADAQSRRTRYQRLMGDGSEPSQAVRYIEGLDELDAKLAEIAGGIYARDAQNVLDRVLPQASLDSQALVEVLSGRAAQGTASSVAEPSPPARRRRRPQTAKSVG